MKFQEISAEEFDKFEHGRLGGGFYQKAKRAIVRKKMGWEIYFLAVLDDEKIRGAGLMMSAGEHEIVISRDGFDEWRKVIAVTEGKYYRLSYPRIFLKERSFEEVLDL